MASVVKPEWLSEIEEFLKCVSCRKTILDPPVRECRVGHLLCGKCSELPLDHSRSAKCPICPGRTQTHISHVAENILTKLPRKKCMFKLCTFARTEARAVGDHELTCIHRTILCYSCQESLPVSGMTAHILTCETSSRVWNQQFAQPLRLLIGKNFGQRILSSPVEISECEVKTTFYLNRVFEDGRYLFWVTHTLAQCETNDRAYQYSISVSTLKDNKSDVMLAQHTGFCTSHDAHPTTMKKAMFCLVVPQEVLEKALDEKERFGLDTTIIRKA